MRCLLSFCRLLLLFLTVHAQAQDVDYRPNFIPPSPDVCALGKYVEYPVGLYTGTIPITIPVYTLSDGALDVPVHLSYHASGNKVDDAASFAGLGFALNAGGVVMRSVRNLPDDYPVNGFCTYSQTYSENYLNTHANRFIQWEEIAKGCADAEPDLYYFNFNGYTGSFTYNWSGAILVNASIAWKVEALRTNPSVPAKITGWKFTSDDGTAYTFTDPEVTTITGNGFPCQAGISYNSAWHLTNIKTPNLGRTIAFTYEDYTQNFNTYTAATHRIFCYTATAGGCQYTAPDPALNMMQLVYNCKRVKNITSSDNATLVTFNYLNTRTDEPGTGLKQLDEVIIKNKDGAELRKFTFTYDYSTGRLTLRSMKKTGTDEPPYKFDYHDEILPPRIGNSTVAGSFGQDHWGFYNGKTDNTTLVLPAWRKDPNAPSNAQVFYKGADRNPDDRKMQAGILLRITYPTGGYDDFWYEAHDYGFIGNQTVESLGEMVTSAAGVEDKHVQLEASADAGPMTQQLVTTLWGEYGTDAQVTLEFRGAKVPGSSACKAELYDNNAPGSPPLVQKTFYPVYDITQDFANLPKGQYMLKVTTTKINPNPTGDPPFDRAYISLQWKSRVYTTEPLKKKKAGGIRIGSVRHFSHAGDANPVYKRYLYDDGITMYKTSSGVLKETPFYEALNLRYYTAGETACQYDLRIAQNKTILGYGSHIGYGKVTECSGYDGANGKLVYTFTTEKDYPAVSSKLPPFQQPSVNLYATGNPTGTAMFKRENDLFKPVSEQTTVNTEIQAAQSINGWKIRFEGGSNSASKFIKSTYEHKIGEWYAVHTLEKEYATDAVNYQQQEKEFEYYGKRLREERLFRNRNAAGHEATTFFYADAFTNPTPALQSMLSKNMIGLPIEIVKSVPDGFTNSVTQASFNTYSLDASSRVFLTEIKKLQRSTPGSFLFASSLPAGVVDANYASETFFEKYDEKENLNQLTGKNGITVSSLYDKHNDAPDVAVRGAAWDKVAWSGFENTLPITFGAAWTLNGTYNTTDVATGKRSFNGIVNITTGFPATSYILSFWMKGSVAFLVNGVSVTPTANWSLYETKVTGNNPVSIDTKGGLVDEVRIYPQDAQMTTTSYDQLIGQNCVSDVKSSPTFYEYDNLWRLHLVKDQNKDIVKRTNYEFEILAPLAYTLNVTQTGNYTYQFQVVGGAAGYTYEFDFDDLSAITSGTATAVSHVFPSITFTYNVKVKIKNSVNTLATLAKEVLIQKSGGSTACSEIKSISVIRSASNPKQISFSVPAISGASYWWDFGDNTSDNVASTTHVYPSSANVVNYNVELTVSAGGKSCTSKTNINIKP